MNDHSEKPARAGGEAADEGAAQRGHRASFDRKTGEVHGSGVGAGAGGDGEDYDSDLHSSSGAPADSPRDRHGGIGGAA